MQEIHDRLSGKLRRRTERLKEASLYVAQNDFEDAYSAISNENNDLRLEIDRLEHSYESLRHQNFELAHERDELASENETLAVKLSAHEERMKATGSFQSQLMSVTTQLREKSQDLMQLEQRHEDLQRRFSEANRLIEDLQTRSSKSSSRLDAMTAENRELKEQNRVLKSQADRSGNLQEEIESLRQQVRKTPARDQADVTRIAEMSRELEQLRVDLQEHEATRIERDTLLQDVKLLQEKVNQLKALDERNVQLSLKIEDVTNTIAGFKLKEKRYKEQISSLLQDREQLEILRKELQRIEEELHEREKIEQKLKTRISHYRTKSQELNLQVESYEEELHELRNKLFTLQTDIVTLPAPVSRVAPSHAKPSSRSKLELARKKNQIADNEITELKHRVARYQAALDAKLSA
jgi:chromosome segregation ATPase